MGPTSYPSTGRQWTPRKSPDLPASGASVPPSTRRNSSGRRTRAAGGRTRATRRGNRGTKLRKGASVDHVQVELPFALGEGSGDGDNGGGDAQADVAPAVGEGCYVTATVGGSRRFYGVLVDQAAMRSASLLHFRNVASDLDLDRRMRGLYRSRGGGDDDGDSGDGGYTEEELGEEGVGLGEGNAIPGQPGSGSKKRPALHASPSNADGGGEPKRRRSGGGVGSVVRAATHATTPGGNLPLQHLPPSPQQQPRRQVQKFAYRDYGNGGVGGGAAVGGGCRTLVATYLDVESASEGDAGKRLRIESACNAGGNYVGEYYYRYEVSEIFWVAPASVSPDCLSECSEVHLPGELKVTPLTRVVCSVFQLSSSLPLLPGRRKQGTRCRSRASTR